MTFATKPGSTLCVVGSLNADLTFDCPRLPEPGETLASTRFHIRPGGKGANQAVMAARLGSDVSMIGCVGADSFGALLTQSLNKHGVRTQHVFRDATQPTGVAAILVDSAAQNSILIAAGANASLTPEHVSAAHLDIQRARIVLCQLEIPLSTTLESFRLARLSGTTTILTPAPVMPLSAELLHLTDVCVLNEIEARALTGVTVLSPQTSTAHLRQLGPRIVILTLGARGCYYSGPEGDQAFPAPEVVAVDTTGAGDAFVGALAAEWTRQDQIRDCIPSALAAAALSVTKPGAQSSYPSRLEVESFLRTHPAFAT